MKKEDKKTKLCWNCEGRIALELERCSYCGVSVQPLMIQGATDLRPLYSFDNRQTAAGATVALAPPAPYEVEKEEASAEDTEGSEAAVGSVVEPMRLLFCGEVKHFVLPLVALQAGVVFLFFGLALYFFSTGQMLTLQWNSEAWYLYLLAALPLLFIGLRSLAKKN